MRRAVLRSILLFALAWPSVAFPCKGDPELHVVLPEGEVPVSVQAYARTDEFGFGQVTATLIGPGAGRPIDVPVRGLVDFWWHIELPPLEDGVEYELVVESSGLRATSRFTGRGPADDAAPRAPTVARYERYSVAQDSCTWGGAYALATLAASSPEPTIYELVERAPDDVIELRGMTFVVDEAGARVQVSSERIAREDEPLTGRCFGVRARDVSGNLSETSPWFCFGDNDPDDPTPPDAGLAPDAGFERDAGGGPSDAGRPPAPDAGEPAAGGLGSTDSGCRAGDGLAASWLAAGALLAGRRRRRSAAAADEDQAQPDEREQADR